MNFIFDFDGTILDSKNRLYQLYQYLCPRSQLTYTEYWALKHKGISHQEILKNLYNYTSAEIDTFVDRWMQLIESNEYLEFDQLFDGVKPQLSKLSGYGKLYLCTARQHKSVVCQQLARFGVDDYFSDILVTEQKKTKADLIVECINNVSNHDWMIGDTGSDIKTGKLIGIKTCAVSYGFLADEILAKYNPDLIIDSVSNLDLMVIK